jgi:hypothetical protein
MVNESVEIVRKWQSEAGYQPPRMPKYSPRRYSVGVDLGQASDPTAIAVLEKNIMPPDTALFAPVGASPSNRLVEGSLVYDLVYLKRPKLGTPESGDAEGGLPRGIDYGLEHIVEVA